MPCFVFGTVVFVVLWGMTLCAISSSVSIVLRNGNWFLYLNCILLLCVHVFVYLGSVIHVYRGPVAARVLDQKQRD